jgi:hypothetical protein
VGSKEIVMIKTLRVVLDEEEMKRIVRIVDDLIDRDDHNDFGISVYGKDERAKMASLKKKMLKCLKKVSDGGGGRVDG